MKIEDLVTEKNRALFERVSAVYKIELRKSTDVTWGSEVKDSTVYISYSDSAYPEACFTHELLHVDTQIKGYKRMLGAISVQKTTNRGLPTLIDCFDNEFQHHKMYKNFEDMTYPAAQFYHDSDAGTLDYLKQELQQRGLDFRRLLTLYFTAVAPGGGMTPDERSDIKNMFHEYGGGIYKSKLKKLDSILEAWVADVSYDAEEYVKQTCNLMDNIKTWITYENSEGLTTENFPSSGFFTDKKFSIDDALKVRGK